MPTLKKIKQEPIYISYSIVKELFERCPFCGNKPNVFQVPETRYGKENPYGWVVECKQMGCIFQRSSANQSFKNLMTDWNTRF